MYCVHGVPQKSCIHCWKKDQFEVCSTCLKRFVDPETMTHINETGMCFGCDHSFGEVLDSQADESLQEGVYE